MKLYLFSLLLLLVSCNQDYVMKEFNLSDYVEIPSLNMSFDSLSSEELAYVADLGLLENYSIPRNKTERYFIHCTCSLEGVDLDGDWFKWFFKERRKWSRPGYSAVILLDGKLDTLKPYNIDGFTDYNEFTYGVKGVNMSSMHFAYVGGCDKKGKAKDTRTYMQKQTLKMLVDYIRCVDPGAKIMGHRDFHGVKKDCPSFSVIDEYSLN